MPPSMLGSDSTTKLQDFTVGKDYFISADRYDPNPLTDPVNGTEPPPDIPIYDVILFYDDDDLSRVGLHSSITADQLSLCYLELYELDHIPLDAQQREIKISEDVTGNQTLLSNSGGNPPMNLG